MALALPSRGATIDPAEKARLQFVLRFGLGTTASFIVCEWNGWQPSALAPVLTGVLLANLPASPPFKVGLGLAVIMGAFAWSAFLATTYLGATPHILFGLVGLVLFLAFHGLAQAKGQLPLTLLLVCLAVVPLTTLTWPAEYAVRMPSILFRSMLLAVIFSWISFAVWPLPMPKPPPPPAASYDNPIAAAAVGAAIVLPLMLIYLLFGLTDAIPVLLTTTLLVAKMEEERSAATAVAKLLGNFLGGLIAIASYYLLQVSPTLTTLALISFIIGVVFAFQIARGGVRGGNAALVYNQTMVIFGLAILKGPMNSGTWSARLVQFGIASVFAVGMMYLLLPRVKAKSDAPQ